MLGFARRFPGLRAGLAFSFALAVGCATTAFDGRVYRQDDLAFHVGPMPARWRAIEVEGALLAFRDDAHTATIALNGRCGLDGDDVPLEALTHHLFLHFTERTLVGKQERVNLDGRAALRSELVAELDGVPMRYLVYVLKKDGCVYDFMHVTPSADPAARADFERFVQGFGTLE